MDLQTTLIYSGFATAATGLAYYTIQNEKNKLDPNYDFDRQSVEIDAKEHIRVSSAMVGKNLIEYRYEDVRTLYHVLDKGLKLSNDGPCLGKRDASGRGTFKWISYSEVIKRVRAVGSGLVSKGIEPSNQSNIGIYASNAPEWVITEHACYAYSFPVVSLYDTFGKESIKWIVNHAQLKAIVLDNFYRLLNVLEYLDEFKSLRLIVYIDELNELRSDKIKSVFESKKNTNCVELLTFDQLMNIGFENPKEPHPPKPSDLATICYTSGTTGIPKGAMITHGNIICNEAAVFRRLFKPELGYELTPQDVHYCYLPLAHMFGRLGCILAFLNGSSCGFLSGDASHILDDLKELKPTNAPMVPRILNKFYTQVYKKLNPSPLKKVFFNHAVSVKLSNHKNGNFNRDTYYDRKVFDELRANFGGRLTKTITSSAPISDEVMSFSRAVLGCSIPEAYGQTESTCAISITHPFDPKIGHVGAPIDCWMVKLVDVPEMGYFAEENKGEVCAKGPSIFLGYLNDPEKTAEVIDKDGWLHTGDIGQWLPDGTLKIIDRKKHLFKLSIGEYISPEKLENIYIKSPYVSQIFVDGNSLKDFCIAIVVPDAEYMSAFLKKNLSLTDPISELCKTKRIRNIVLNDLLRVGKNSSLNTYELLRGIHLHVEPFSVENGFLTPTLKLKRQNLHNHFKKIIDELYVESEEDARTFSHL